MPAVRLIVFKYYTLLASSIAFNSEIISLYSYYMKKGLVCVIITDLFGYQPSSCFKCIKSNTYVSCNMHSVSLNKYTFLTCLNSR